jgi:integrase
MTAMLIQAQISHIAQRADVSSKMAPHDWWTAPWDHICDMALLPESPLSADIMMVPESWVHTKSQRRACERTVDFTAAVPEGVDRASVEGTLRRLKRLAAILYCTPIIYPAGGSRQPPNPTTWAKRCRNLILAARWSLGHVFTQPSSGRCPDDGPIFTGLNRAMYDRLMSADGLRSFSGVAASLSALYYMGVIDDWFDGDVGNGHERRRKNATVPVTDVQTGRKWQPLPDEFVARLGAASLWMMERLGPALLDTYEALRGTAPAMSPDETPDAYQRRAQYARRGALELIANARSVEWDFPLAVLVQEGNYASRTNRAVALQSWPPPTPQALRVMLSMLQAAHLSVVALATAARDSELMGLDRDCLQPSDARHMLVGTTFKLSEAAGGERRNWPLPRVAVAAIRQQQRLADLFDPEGRALWVSVVRDTDGLKSFRELLPSFCKLVVLDGKPLGVWCTEGTVHPHRFRKTVARLAALSMIGATPILFDILGHRDPEMTLNYILSDPELQDEIRLIASEANIVLAKQAVDRAEENGGATAVAVVDLKRRLAARSGEAEIGVDSLAEAAEILSMNGQVTMVKPGVLCTKSMGQRGFCTKKAGIPDIGNCSTGCHHRLEHAAAADDCAKSIERILSEMPPPENVLMRGWWQAQLVGQLRRFPLLRRRFLAEERVQAALVGVDAATIEELLSAPGECVCRGDAA